jgi:hypothetical protein
MDATSKQLWIITTSSLIVSVLLLLSVRFPRFAFDLQLSGSSLWAFFLLAPIGLALSVLGLRAAGRTQGIMPRGIGYLVNASAVAINGVIILATFSFFLGTTDERILIPEGYRGTVYIFYNVKSGQGVDKTFKSLNLTVPDSGVLLVRDPMFTGWTRTVYLYARPDGISRRLLGSWPDGTKKMDELLKSDNDVGVFFPRAGGVTIPGCTAEYEQFSVGTKAELNAQHEDDELLPAYLRAHSELCVSTLKDRRSP